MSDFFQKAKSFRMKRLYGENKQQTKETRNGAGAESGCACCTGGRVARAGGRDGGIGRWRAAARLAGAELRRKPDPSWKKCGQQLNGTFENELFSRRGVRFRSSKAKLFMVLKNVQLFCD
jgi:hypothetical protein